MRFGTRITLVLVLLTTFPCGACAQAPVKLDVMQQAQSAPAPIGQSGERAAPAAPQLGRPIPQDDPAEGLAATRPAQRIPAPPADLVAVERKKIWAEFRADYDAHGPGDRGPLAHKLLRLAIGSDPPAERRLALLREAQELAADARDRATTMKSADAIAFYFDVDPLKEKLHALSAAAWPDDEESAARTLMDDWMGLSAGAIESSRFDIADQAAGRAAAVARHWGDEQWVRSAEAQLQSVADARDRKARLDAAIKVLASRPHDPQANLVVGCALAVKSDWANALPMLNQSDDAVIRLAAGRDLAEPTQPNAQVNLAEAWAGASERQSPDVRDAFGKRARHWYTLALRGLSGPDKVTVERRMRALPGGTIFDAAALGVAAPRRIGPQGGRGGGEFTELPARGALLTGFRLSTGPIYGNPCISALEPIFQTEVGKLEGATHGHKQGEFKTIEGKKGYAVGGIVVKTGLAVDGFKIVFMRISGDALDPNDKYESPWIGGRGGSPETPLGCDGKPVIGILGRAGDGLDAVGLLQAP